jgi:hypothetical protein
VRKVDTACRGTAALRAAEKVLELPELAGVQLYSFRAAAKHDRLCIKLDKVKVAAMDAADISTLPCWHPILCMIMQSV